MIPEINHLLSNDVHCKSGQKNIFVLMKTDILITWQLNNIFCLKITRN